MYDKTVRISSRDRSSGSSTNFNVEMAQPVQATKRAMVVRACIPKTFHNVPATSRLVDFQENVGIAAVATLVAGWYNATTLSAALKAALDAASPNARTYTVSVSATTGLMTIAVSTGTFSILGATGANAASFATVLTHTLGYATSDTTTASSQVAPSLFNADAGIDGFNISVRTWGPSQACVQTTNTIDNVIARVPITGITFGDLNQYKNDSDAYPIALINGTSALNVTLRGGPSDEILDLNGAEWWFDVTLE